MNKIEIFNILKNKLPEDLCFIIIKYYENITSSKTRPTLRNITKLKKLIYLGRNTIHISDMPDRCNIENLLDSLDKISIPISHICCSGNGVVISSSQKKIRHNRIYPEKKIRHNCINPEKKIRQTSFVPTKKNDSCNIL